jgi:hypothetical protein
MQSDLGDSTTAETVGLPNGAVPHDPLAKAAILHFMECVFVTALFAHFAFSMLSEFNLFGKFASRVRYRLIPGLF